MREMTEEEVADETHMIRAHELWPVWPVLPVKNGLDRDERGWPRHGIIVSGGLRAGVQEPVKVYIVNLFDLKTGPLGPQLEGKETIEFETVETMVRAGWIGD